MMLEQDFHDSCEDIGKQFAAMWMTARHQAIATLPARRCDEQGWMIGHMVPHPTEGKVCLTYQEHVDVLWSRRTFPEDDLRALIAKVPDHAIISALPRRGPQNYQCHDIQSAGMYIRCLLMPDTGCIRLDVLIGTKPLT